ncbi:galactolipase DONGLE, chloroplastic [Cajanus cajan]|uniref:Lipase n=1 Tax=Cajanus cajan TaxID=3821 RepID=A0A151TDE9_CAJCA|nr:galactolipase DONGLE, chloroplastic [Cajanus cajan]KYP65068.1 Lipase [Cajanus cajan]
MASVTHTTNTNHHHITVSRTFHQTKSHPFGQVSLPITKTDLSPLSHPILPSKIPVSKTRATHTHSLSKLWREVHGCYNWENLLDPLHPLLRQEIIRYGEFVTASYKAFDLDPNSKRYLNCKYGKKRMFQEVGMARCGYEVTKYIYATPDINLPTMTTTKTNSSSSGRWIGYVAVSSDEAVKRLGRRDILITFRGTVTNQEWISNFMSSLTPAMLDPYNPRPQVKVESGFLSLYTSDESSSKFGLESCREQLLSEVSRLMKRYEGENHNLSISLAGHSLGSALAILLAYDLAELGLNKISNLKSVDANSEVPVTVFSFGGPRVGNSEFKHRCDELGVKVLRIANVNDPITKLPGVVFNENFRVLLGGKYEFPRSCSCYAHVGVELMLNFFNVQNPSCVHDLDSYIGLLRRPKKDDQVLKREVGVNSLLEKGRQLLLNYQSMKILPGVLTECNYHDLLNSLSRDILCSWSDELLFGLVLLLL